MSYNIKKKHPNHIGKTHTQHHGLIVVRLIIFVALGPGQQLQQQQSPPSPTHLIVHITLGHHIVLLIDHVRSSTQSRLHTRARLGQVTHASVSRDDLVAPQRESTRARRYGRARLQGLGQNASRQMEVNGVCQRESTSKHWWRWSSPTRAPQQPQL
jgi:hypothetical protein